MRPTFPLGLALGWSRVVIVFIVCVGLLAAGAAARAGWWAGAAIATLMALLVLLTWRGASLLELISSRPLSFTLPVATNHTRSFGNGAVGIRAEGTQLVAVVAVDGPPHSVSVLDRQQVESPATLSLKRLATGLRQCDLTLAGIDIVAVGARRAPKTHHHGAPAYSSRVGDHPAMGQRRTWLVVRLDAFSAAGAILCRESAAATLAAAAEQLAADLTGCGCPARTLTAKQITKADDALLAGVDLKTIRRNWRHLRHRGGYIQTYWVSPRDISSADIDRLWAPDVDAAAITVQLRPTTDGGTTVGVLARYHTGGPLQKSPLTGLNPLTGRHDRGFAAGLIRATTALVAPARRIRQIEDLYTPIGANGIILGTTVTGHRLLVDLTPAPGKTTAVSVVGEPALTVQLALRAAETGYQVLIHTEQAERWRHVIAPGLRLVDSEGPGQQLPTARRPWLVVYDDVPGTVPQGAAVVVRTARCGADIELEQADDEHIEIRTRDLGNRLHVDLDNERRIIAPELLPAG